ncbi:MAG: hypothetical protein K940chlam8_00743 [Chlamydiae bacterium]|nr:hypothetical protein [Chlamydiota bacterium]
MSTEKPSNTWGYWCKRRFYEQFEDEHYHRTAVVASAGAFLGTYRITKRPDHAIIVGGIVGVLFLLYEIHSVPSAPFEIARDDSVDFQASELAGTVVPNVTQIDALQNLVTCAIMMTGTALGACSIWNCNCAQLILYNKEVVEQSFKTFRNTILERAKPGEQETVKKSHISEGCVWEDVKKCPHCNKMGNLTLVDSTIMRELIQLMHEKKWDEIVPKIERIPRFDKKSEELENSVPVMNVKGETYMISKGEPVPKGYRINDPLLKLMNYINEGGALAAEIQD